MMGLLEHITVAESDAAALSAPAADTQPGRLVAGRYRIGSLLGRGGMARVFLADDELLHRPVALKRPVAEPSGPPAIGMLDEAWAATRVNHPGSVKVLDV